MNWKKISNPFSFYSEKNLFIFGIIGFIVLNFVSYFNKMIMDGIWHIGYAKGDNLLANIVQNLIIAASSILVLWVMAYLFNNKTRIIDIVNTVLVSFIPNIIIILISGLSYFNQSAEKLNSIANKPEELMKHSTELFWVLVSSLCVIPFLIYSIILLYNGFRTATNMKTWQKISLFFIVIFILNTATQFLI